MSLSEKAPGQYTFLFIPPTLYHHTNSFHKEIDDCDKGTCNSQSANLPEKGSIFFLRFSIMGYTYGLF